MKIVVCPLSQVPQMVAKHAPERVVSLLDPDFAFPNLGAGYRGRHLQLALHDVHDGGSGRVLPDAGHVDQLLAFLMTWQCSAPILIHCRAGIGRSTATAFIAACLFQPKCDERELALNLRRASPLARPNEILVRLADTAMKRNGRMTTAIEETGRGLAWHQVDENIPFELACSSRSELF